MRGRSHIKDRPPMDLFDFMHELNELPLCKHPAQRQGWTKDADPKSPYHGCWVHAHPDCLRPAHLKELIK